MMYDVICKKCGTHCEVDGDYPRFTCWCDECNREAEGFDILDYGADWLGDMIDYAKERCDV